MTDAQVSKRQRLAVWLVTFGVATTIVAMFLFWALHVSAQQAEDRITARYVVCLELEAAKKAQRVDLEQKIADSEEFLANGRSIPGISAAEIQRGIDRNKALLDSVQPVDCVQFARDPQGLDVEVPPLPPQPEDEEGE